MPNAIGSRRTRGHPPWCNEDRCLAQLHRLGEHRSEPIMAFGRTAGARLIATRVESPDHRQWLEVLLNIPLLGDVEPRRAQLADRVLHGLVYTVDASIGLRA